MSPEHNLLNASLKFMLWNEPTNMNFTTQLVLMLADKLNFSPEFQVIEYKDYKHDPGFPMAQLVHGLINASSGYCRHNLPEYDVGMHFMQSEIVAALQPRKIYSLRDIIFKPFHSQFSNFLVSFIILSIVLVKLDMFLCNLESDTSFAMLMVVGLFYGYSVKTKSKLTGKISIIVRACLVVLNLHIQPYRQGIIFVSRTFTIIDQKPKSLKDLGPTYKMQAPNMSYNKVLFTMMDSAFKNNLYGVTFTKFSTLELLSKLKTAPYNYGVLIDLYNLRSYIETGLLDIRTHIVSGVIMKFPRCFFFQLNSRLTKMFDLYLSWMIESGIIGNFLGNQSQGVQIQMSAKLPSKIRVYEFKFVFEYFFCSLLLSFVAFIGEVLYEKRIWKRFFK